MALTNDVRLIGFCGTMPRLNKTREGRAICFMPVYTEHWVYSGEAQKTYKELHWCVFSGRNAERAKRLLMKGSQVYIRGANHYRKVEREGKQEIKPQIIVEEFMITTKAIMTKAVYDHIFSEENKPKKNEVTEGVKLTQR